MSANQIASLLSDLLVGKSAKDIDAIFYYNPNRGYGYVANSENKVIIDKLEQKGIRCFIDGNFNRMYGGAKVRIEKPANIKSRYNKAVEYQPSEILVLVAVTEKGPFSVTLEYKLDTMGLNDQEWWEKVHKEKVDLVHRVSEVVVKPITYQQMKKARNWEYHRDLYRGYEWVPGEDKKRWANVDKEVESMRAACEREGSAKFTYGT